MEKVLAEALERGRTKGLTDDQVIEAISGALVEATPGIIDESATRLYNELQGTAPRMLARHARLQRGFESRVRWVWGEALDALYAVNVCCQELGADFNDTYRPHAARNNDLRFEALVRLHARACVTASELYALLRTGHALGARARWRTLHELAVVSSVLGKGDNELSNRFLLHSAAESYVDACEYQKHAATAGREPIPAADLKRLQQTHDLAISKYGPKFATPWRWAEPVTTPAAPTFWRLEKLAGLDHLRPDVRAASHWIHSGSSGTALVHVPFRDQTIMLAGPSNFGLAAPGHGSAISLVQVTIALVRHGQPFEHSPLVPASLKALLLLVDRTGEAFSAAHHELENAEAAAERAQARGGWAWTAYLARRRMRVGAKSVTRMARRVRARSRHLGQTARDLGRGRLRMTL